MVYDNNRCLALVMGAMFTTFLLYSSGLGPIAMGQNISETIRLPPPSTNGAMSVEEVLQNRRSIRDFAALPLSLEAMSQLLWSAQGITSPDGYRTAPSAGALYPIEIFVVVGNVQKLDAGVYRYAPEEHELIPFGEGDRRRRLSEAALNQMWMAQAPAILVVTGVVERTERKYRARALRYVQIEVGHVAQNVYLQATALGLGTVFVGAFRDERVTDVLRLPEDHSVFCLMPVGSAK